ncbi:MAG: TAT-variant-translocated molybdopterin oxidoreductase [Flavobacteriales bacterium]|nr:TAT-variant-translocated molybdopterin oxidoreductase [Flavobacteriales bacterium]
MSANKTYWSGVEELDRTSEFERISSQEFPAERPIDAFLSDERLEKVNTGRRDFLKFMGFSLTAATLAACETPVVKSIPYVNKPEDITPGVANYYASTMYNGSDYASVLVKTREGRPISIKPHAASPLGQVNARVNADVLGLYDSERLQGPVLASKASTWADVDGAAAKAAAVDGRKVVLTNTILSPSLQRAIDGYCAAHSADHVQYDAVGYGAIRQVAREDFGRNEFPSLDFSSAQTVVSLGADFMGTWGEALRYNEAWASRRRPETGAMGKLYAFEANLSLTGSNADHRTMVAPADQGRVAAALLGELTGHAMVSDMNAGLKSAVALAARDLKAAGSKGLVVAGSNDLNIQRLVGAINRALGAFGTTIKWEGNRMFAGDHSALASLTADMNAGKVALLVMHGCNPAYNAPDAEGFIAGLDQVGFSASTALYADETSSRCTASIPTHHWLESWGDLQRASGSVELMQPTISPLFNSREAGESFLAWTGAPQNWNNYVRGTMDAKVWNEGLYAGSMSNNDAVEPAADVSAVSILAPAMAVNETKGGKFQATFYQKVTIGDGQSIGNPMLQETPDPISKVTWDNYVTMSRGDMEDLGLNLHLAEKDPASLVRVTVGNRSVELPAFMQPGQAPGTVGIAIGYGRGASGEAIGRAAYQVGGDGEHLADENGNLMPIGENAFALVGDQSGLPQYVALDVSIESTGETYALACTQMHHTFMGRDSIVKETTLGAFVPEMSAARGEASWNKAMGLGVHADINGDGEINALDKKTLDNFDMWHEHAVDEVGHRWGMAIDLTSCTGCSACVTACHIENNVAVVGKDEVLRHRDMHWMRIDRFYASDWNKERGAEEGLGVVGTYAKMEEPSANPETVHMPMMCQHCSHAPCETVCPVAATTHSNEGMNQMAYNRCIGTRYCANNCPFKVRRFNWFNYNGNSKFQNSNPAQDAMMRLVLNPDVVVRTRGVMEKCSLCVQRTQEGKLAAKKAGQPVVDGAIQTACAEACPTHAITFGDLNDRQSEVRATYDNNRAYHALEEVGIQPNIAYLTKVRNNDKA